MKKQLAVFVSAAVVAGGLMACSSDEDEHDINHHGDDHGLVDPQKTDPGVIGQSVTRLLLTWDPSQQGYPLDVTSSVKEQTTGDLAALLFNPHRADHYKWTPAEWKDWEAAGATITAFVDTPEVEVNGDKAVMQASFTQRLDYPDGTSSTWHTGTVTTELKAVGSTWKVTSVEPR